MTLTHRDSEAASDHRSAGRRWSLWTALTCLELALATTLVVLDVLIPSVLLVVLAGISLLVRRRGFASLGFHRVERPWVLVGRVLVAVLLWSLLLVLCWPLALLILLAWPFLWLLSIPFRIVATVMHALLAFVKALLFLPARLLGHQG